jgi:hypothetical protein
MIVESTGFLKDHASWVIYVSWILCNLLWQGPRRTSISYLFVECIDRIIGPSTFKLVILIDLASYFMLNHCLNLKSIIDAFILRSKMVALRLSLLVALQDFLSRIIQGNFLVFKLSLNTSICSSLYKLEWKNAWGKYQKPKCKRMITR